MHGSRRSRLRQLANLILALAPVYPQYIRAEDEEEIKEAVNLPAKRPFELGSHATYGRGRSQNMEEEDLEASGDKRKQSWAGRLFSRAKRANKIHVLPDGVEGVFEPLQNQGIGHGPMVSCEDFKSCIDMSPRI